MSFPESIERAYRVVETRYGGGESESTIPLGSWRKGRGLAGARGHVYLHGADTAGVWLIHGAWRRFIESLRVEFPNLFVMQSGDGEATFRVPMADLERLLPLIGAKKKRKATAAMVAALARARESSPIGRAEKAIGPLFSSPAGVP